MRQALHELSSPLGLAHASLLADEVDAHAALRHIDRMRHGASALRSLIGASSVPQLAEGDLAPRLREFEGSPPIECDENLVLATGPAPFVVRGDLDLLTLAVQPLVANAIEAVLAVGDSATRGAVIVSWGYDSAGCYVAVIDKGPGPPAPIDALIPLGATDKDGHVGFGLETSRTAITALRGSLALEANDRGGSTAQLRWPGRP